LPLSCKFKNSLCTNLLISDGNKVVKIFREKKLENASIEKRSSIIFSNAFFLYLQVKNSLCTNLLTSNGNKVVKIFREKSLKMQALKSAQA
jgi:hypothetical protein